MKRFWILLLLAILAAVSLRMSRTFTPHLVNYVVYRAFLQKMPQGFSSELVRKAFERSYTASSSSETAQRRCLEMLFMVSQKLEKVQRLSQEETYDILEQVRGAADGK